MKSHGKLIINLQWKSNHTYRSLCPRLCHGLAVHIEVIFTNLQGCTRVYNSSVDRFVTRPVKVVKSSTSCTAATEFVAVGRLLR